MQQIMIYQQSIILQHVSGVFTPITRRADCVPLPMVSCPGYGYCGSGESGGEMCALCRGCCLRQQPQPGQETIGSDTQSALQVMGVKTPETCWGITDCR